MPAVANKRRCTYCRGYYTPGEMLRAGVSGVCSSECLSGLQDKYRYKRERRRVHRARKNRYGKRLNGSVRDKVRRRDGNVCRYCGGTNRLQIHHIEYRSQGGEDVAHNLITLCSEHHALMHTSKLKWQPILRGVMWAHYVWKVYYTIPEVERRFTDLLRDVEVMYDGNEAPE